jgi:hypothetical protein
VFAPTFLRVTYSKNTRTIKIAVKITAKRSTRMDLAGYSILTKNVLPQIVYYAPREREVVNT